MICEPGINVVSTEDSLWRLLPFEGSRSLTVSAMDIVRWRFSACGVGDLLISSAGKDAYNEDIRGKVE